MQHELVVLPTNETTVQRVVEEESPLLEEGELVDSQESKVGKMDESQVRTELKTTESSPVPSTSRSERSEKIVIRQPVLAKLQEVEQTTEKLTLVPTPVMTNRGEVLIIEVIQIILNFLANLSALTLTSNHPVVRRSVSIAKNT